MADKAQQDRANEAGITGEQAFRPITRVERRNLWLRDYEEQDIALQSWARLVERQDGEVEIMLQMHGLLIFGVLVSTRAYAQFYIDLHEEQYRQQAPETADFLREYYTGLIPPSDQPEIGPEGLPIMYRYAHMRDVTIISAGHQIKLPYWRGKLSEVDAFVVGASAEE